MRDMRSVHRGAVRDSGDRARPHRQEQDPVHRSAGRGPGDRGADPRLSDGRRVRGADPAVRAVLHRLVSVRGGAVSWRNPARMDVF
ncbi:hypothetical protein SCOCK_120088 [Actinacidiphila cocklensis]|uniref:Uncharacterized protein n=1 Tax=Actinacidiphila cocklensis TaxID=887465 RepID=A0A9W4GNN9_9ACTN|nr:hypothetical protein SCOCK_120088 [Actinacidiphila cocklensis]